MELVLQVAHFRQLGRKHGKHISELGMGWKTYLICRDEIMRDLQKNINIFNEER